MNNSKYIKKRKPHKPAHHSKEYNQMLFNELCNITLHTDTRPEDLTTALNIASKPIL